MQVRGISGVSVHEPRWENSSQSIDRQPLLEEAKIKKRLNPKALEEGVVVASIQAFSRESSSRSVCAVVHAMWHRCRARRGERSR